MAKFFDRFSMRTRLIGGSAALLALGTAIGGGIAHSRPVPAMVPTAPAPIAAMANAASSSLFGHPIVTVRGQVVAIYGGSFLLKDASGQALVDAGRFGQSGLVAAGQTVTVQGDYDNGRIRARYLVGADGLAYAVGGHGGRHGEGHGGGRDGDRRDAAPPAAAVPAPVASAK